MKKFYNVGPGISFFIHLFIIPVTVCNKLTHMKHNQHNCQRSHMSSWQKMINTHTDGEVKKMFFAVSRKY